LAKKEKIEGKIEYTVDAKRHGVDIYEFEHDKQTGFAVKFIGFHPAEKVTDFSWSGVGDVFAICEKDGPSTASKQVWSFYFIEQILEVPAEKDEIKLIIRGKGGKQLAMQNKNQLAAS